MDDSKPDNQVRGCSQLLVQSMPSAAPWGTPPTLLKRFGATPVFIHTYGRGQMKSRNATYLHPPYAVGLESSRAREKRCSKFQLDKTLSSSRLHHLLTPYTIQLKQPPSKNISQLADNSTSLFLLNQTRSFISYSQEPRTGIS